METEWPPSDAGSDRGRIDGARQNAENLFRPRQQASNATASASAADGPSSAAHQPQRQPRIFMIPPAASMSAAKVKAPARQRTVGRKIREIPASQFGRVRALATYGMTWAQVAELYAVGVDEIERIIRRADSSRIA